MSILKTAGITFLVLIAITMLGYIGYGMLVTHNNDHKVYCDNWSTRISEAKSNLSTLFGVDAQTAQLNNEINQYNHECAQGF